MTRKPPGRAFGKEVRIHKTYWVSEEEDLYITDYLRKRRQKPVIPAVPGRDRFDEKRQRIRERNDTEKQEQRRLAKLLKEWEALEAMQKNGQKPQTQLPPGVTDE